MKRHKHGLSHYKLATFDMGGLVPIGAYEVLPGDTIQHATSMLLRVSPLVAPVMHPVNVRVHHWFVPYRILWDGWEDFITGVDDTPPPTFSITPAQGSVADYIGIPPGRSASFVEFPITAYNTIWNEFYRDQDLQSERTLTDNTIAPVAWEKDYFTTARPWAQKGEEVTLPLGTVADVIPNPAGNLPIFQIGSEQRGLGSLGGSQNVLWDGGNVSGTAAAGFAQSGLVADLSTASAVNVNEVRRAFALQRYQEARALYGSRYTEYLAYLGVRSSDGRLQRPEYLGGGKSTISFSEVLKTGSGEDPTVPIGAMSGHGISAMRSRRWRRFFEEHGVVLTLATVRPRSIYSEGIHRSWLRTTKEDFWQKELEFIGQQEINAQEVYSGASGTFGYGDRYSEYRSLPSNIAGEFRTELNYWHLARQFTQAPVLNADFIQCDPGKRIFAEQTQHSLWGMFGHQIQARRMVANSTVGRVI